MYAAAMRMELLMRGVGSLKEKRHVVKSLLEELHAMRVSVAEVDHQDKWQRSAVGVSVVASQYGHLDRVLHSVRRVVEAREGVELLEYEIAHLEEAM